MFGDSHDAVWLKRRIDTAISTRSVEGWGSAVLLCATVSSNMSMKKMKRVLTKYQEDDESQRGRDVGRERERERYIYKGGYDSR